MSMILLVPKEKVKADDVNYKILDYSKFEENYNKFSNLIEIAKDYLIQYDETHYYFIMFSNSEIRVYLARKSENVAFSMWIREREYSTVYTFNSNQYYYVGFNATSESDFNTKFEQFKTKVSNNNFEKDVAMLGTNASGAYSEISENSLILCDTNFDRYVLRNNSTCNLKVNDTIISPGSKIPTYSEIMNASSSINISSSFANDLDNKNLEIVKIDFSNIYDDSYIYQYRTNFSDWKDISSYIDEAAFHGHYYYSFNTYYNIFIEARVLNNNHQVIDSNSFEITSLTEYSDNYIFRNSFDNINNKYLGSITFQTNFDELNIPHKFRLQYLANDYKLSNIPTFENYEAYLIDINGFILNYNFSDYFSISYNEYKLFEDDYEKYLDGVITQIKKLPLKVYGIKIYFNFDNLNNYTINVFDNYNKKTEWDYMNNFLDNYIKVDFPSDYDTAIIRSKSYENLSSSIIFLDVMFSNPNFGLKFYKYDFNNNLNKFSYDKTTINIDYSSISFDIDEVNKIFPILYKPIDNENVSFYISNDCFVQFVNRETLDNYLIGTDYDDFNNNNDLVIHPDFNDFVDDNFNFDDRNFFSIFTSSFNSFKNVIIDIFSNITYFYENLSYSLKYFYIVIFVFVMLLFMIKFIL